MTEIATDPVSALLGIGKMRMSLASEWTDYRAEFGLTEDHVPALVRMAVDPQLNGAGADSQELWAPLHAWRALGQLRAVPAIDPLLRYFGRIEEDDYLDSDFPLVFGMIGYKALQPLIAFVGARRGDTFKCAVATDAIKEIASCHPEHRDECIAALTTILDSRRRFDPELNGIIVAHLLDLKAVEAIGTIRAAFERDAVEPSVAGDLEDIEIKLGFRETRSTPAPRFPLFSRWEESEPPLPKFVKTGRNDACPCGSGKKYKKCCMV